MLQLMLAGCDSPELFVLARLRCVWLREKELRGKLDWDNIIFSVSPGNCVSFRSIYLSIPLSDSSATHTSSSRLDNYSMSDEARNSYEPGTDWSNGCVVLQDR